MRIATSCFVGVALLLCTTMAFAIAPNNAFNIADIEAQKAAAVVVAPQPDPIYANTGGDTFATATVIPGIPYADTGNTSGFASNYESCFGCFDCPYSSTGGRDVVYKYTPAADIVVNVDLCSDGTTYDTKTYICDGVVTNIVGCSDDECGVTPPVGWKSLIHCAQLLAGHTYYFVVDAYSSTDYGNYALSINECTPCIVNCPPGSLAEGEPTCHDNYYDSYNGGCNSVPPAFTNIICNDQTQTICGTYGVYDFSGLTYRDTDWYQINLTAPAAITWCATGEYPILVGVIDGHGGCPVSAFYDYNLGDQCTPVCVTDNLSAGTWWLFVSTPGWDTTWVCGGDYVATLTGLHCTVAVEPTNWGTIKNLYR